eukprot:TRINITY_DN12295_c0_g1_i1.p1 TRINITY_DN12295_c0_g1~~TRINITY_DN12295_c0_g1_i1.p1  ORF type:complete len:235 (+),score=97.30 TRINITY_DN12295_c0_g1_i1:56-706(+)
MPRWGSVLLLVACFAAAADAGKKQKAGAKRPRPSERFEELQDLVGHYASAVCMRTARKMTPEDAPRLLVVRNTACDMFADRLEHMIAVSGNDALRQLHGEEAERKDDERKRKAGKPVAKRDKMKRKLPSKEYYKAVVDLAGTGAYEQQLLKTLRKASEWVLGEINTPTPKEISDKLQPEVGQWLINVAANTDPHVTSKELRDEKPEPLLDPEDEVY